MIRSLFLSLFISSHLYAGEVGHCGDREVIFRPMLEQPLVTELKEGSVRVLSTVNREGTVESVKIIFQEGDLRWGKQVVKLMKETKFSPASTGCEYDYKQIVKFGGNEGEN